MWSALTDVTYCIHKLLPCRRGVFSPLFFKKQDLSFRLRQAFYREQVSRDANHASQKTATLLLSGVTGWGRGGAVRVPSAFTPPEKKNHNTRFGKNYIPHLQGNFKEIQKGTHPPKMDKMGKNGSHSFGWCLPIPLFHFCPLLSRTLTPFSAAVSRTYLAPPLRSFLEPGLAANVQSSVSCLYQEEPPGRPYPGGKAAPPI